MLYKREGGILSLSGPALLDILRAMLDKRVPIRFTAPGFSMSPFVKDRDVITVLYIAEKAIRFGDVVAFINLCNERLIVHRVVGNRKDASLIKGDNNPETDGWIPHERILGRVTRIERAGQHIRLGLGIERIVIAFLSQRGWLLPVLTTPRWIYHRIIKRFIA